MAVAGGPDEKGLLDCALDQIKFPATGAPTVVTFPCQPGLAGGALSGYRTPSDEPLCSNPHLRAIPAPPEGHVHERARWQLPVPR